ncbi:MAG TPA: response regulator transcription factor [Dyella sp.]|nr:response regulator transcription factor [Dyella sp.]
MMDHRPAFTYGNFPAIRVALLDDRVGSHYNPLLQTLRGGGFQAEVVASATTLYRAVLAQRVTIAVVDPDLTGENGFAVAQHLRDISNVGIVMLTAPGRSWESIQALRNGADLVLPKPIEADLLVATLHSLAHRLTHRTGAEAVADRSAESGWRIQAHGWQLASPNGHVVSLTAAEQRIIALLARENGQLVSRQALLETVAPDAYDFDPHRIEMIIHRLRRKVRNHTGETLPLRTVRGRGYLFTCKA